VLVGRSIRSKLLLLVGIPLVALLVLGAASLVGARRASSDLARLEQQELVLKDAAWSIRYLDEVLTHSAARYIQSEGNEQWWARYNDAVVELDAALATAKELSSSDDLASLTSVDDANLRLIELETQISELVVAGRYDDARDILQGEYEVQKAVYSDGVDAFFDASVARTAAVVDAQRARANTFTVVVAVLGVIAAGLVVAALFLAGSIIRPIRRLTAVANRTAEVDLPSLVETVQEGGEIDATPAFVVSGDDELAELATAFNAMQSTAVRLAGEQATMRRGASEMFVNLGRRNQGLLGRSLGYITALERNERDPKVLDELFRLDHLATRMRRNAESLLVLADAGHGRVARKPMSLRDVVRSAQSEIEHYTRVDFSRVAHAQVQADFVADLTHLVAELLENATNFSEPSTKVVVAGKATVDGYALSIVDEGLGMSPAALADANRRITERSTTDTSGSKLGLYVVGRLAARYGIDVQLYEAPTDGTIAKVKIPSALLVDETQTDGELPKTELAAPTAPQLASAAAQPTVDRGDASVEPARELAVVSAPDESLRVANALTTPPASSAPSAPSAPSTLATPVAPSVPATDGSDEDTSAAVRRRVRGAQLFDTGPASVSPDEAAARRRNARHDHNRLGSFQTGVRRAVDRQNEETEPS
jgi:signal transduction histidine kinase